MIPETYTLPQLSAYTGIALNTLRQWYADQWLQPYCYSGNRPRFRLEEFEQARLQSLQHAARAAEPAHTSSPRPHSRTDISSRIQEIFRQ